MDNKPKNSTLSAFFLEVGIAAVLVILILGTLNYFGIIPLSKSFPFLSFLPSQSQGQNYLGQFGLAPNQPNSKVLPNLNGKTIRTRGIVIPTSPKTFVNNGSTILYSPIASGGAKFTRQARVDVELTVNNGASGSGILFTNGKKFADKDYKAFRIFHNGEKNNWQAEYRSQNKSTYTMLVKSTSKGNEFRKIAFIISANGKVFTIFVSGVPSKIIQLSDSFYGAGQQIFASVQVAPKSELEINSLYYQY